MGLRLIDIDFWDRSYIKKLKEYGIMDAEQFYALGVQAEHKSGLKQILEVNDEELEYLISETGKLVANREQLMQRPSYQTGAIKPKDEKID